MLHMLAFCEFSFGPDLFCEFSFGPHIIIFTNAPGLPRGEVWQDRPVHGAGLELGRKREKSTLALPFNFRNPK